VLNKKFWISFVPATTWFVIIVVGSFISSSKVPSIGLSDKGIHFLFYTIFAFLLTLPLRINTKRAYSCVTTSVIVLLIGSSIGVLIELAQHLFVVGRFGEYLDVLANTIGLIVGLILCEILKRKSVL
jgi:VanZ family protein